MISRISRCADRARADADRLPSFASRPLMLCVWAMILIGFCSRLSPFVDPAGRIFWQFMTEDGYLMQTVARNMALGLGMSTSEGTIPTNGVQPLATFFFAALHFLAGGSKLAGIALVTVFSTLVAAVASCYLYRLGQRVFAGMRHGNELAALSAAAWFAAPKIVDHSMNGLETGVYYLAIVVTLNYYIGTISDAKPDLEWRQRLMLGFLLGMTFLARNDAVFFIGGLLFAHLVLGNAASAGFSRRFVDCTVAGVASLAVGAPWLINNYALFGSIVPVSGLSESHGISLGQNLAYIPAGLLEAGFVFVPVPGAIEATWLVIVLSCAAIAASLSGFWVFHARLQLATRRFFLGGVLFTAAVVIYYGIFFGVEFFIPRYTSALSPFLWLCTTATTFLALPLLFRQAGSIRRAAVVITTAIAVVCLALALSGYRKGRSHMHKQVVEWVQENVDQRQWIGAIQTGTLGFFYDRTINLDGKVNPDALRARRLEGHVLNYIVDSKINYLADWAGITSWMTREESPRFVKEFEIVVKDEQHNLGVLRRVRPVRQIE